MHLLVVSELLELLCQERGQMAEQGLLEDEFELLLLNLVLNLWLTALARKALVEASGEEGHRLI